MPRVSEGAGGTSGKVRGMLGAVLLAGLVVTGSAGSGEAAGVGGSAPERLQATLEAAVAASPSLAALRAAVTARAAEGRAEAAAGVPWVELQQEGVGSGFRWEANAQTTLRLGTPFNLPSHARARRDLEDTALAWSEAAWRGAALETAREVAGLWLDLAAVEGRLAVARRRLARLERALALERVRLDLGEVAGTDVTQIELAWAGVLSTVDRLESGRKAAREALLRYCAARCAFPEAGDLEELVRLTVTPEVGPDPVAFLEASPLWRSRRLRAELDLSGARVMESTAWGRPEAEVEWEHIPGLEGLPSFDAFGVRVRFPLPAGKAGNRTREAAAARRMEAEAGLQVERADLMARLNSAREAARIAEGTLERLEPVLLGIEGSEHSLAEQFRLGAISYLVYIDGASRFDEVRLQVVEARNALLRARLELAVLGADAAGFPLPEEPTGTGKE